jgi:type I restriction enzyme, S subunit
MSAPANFLLSHFDRLAEAPGGIAKLRALILQLAVQGKLIAQLSADPRVRLEPPAKAKGKGRRITSENLDDEDWPHKIPAMWAWTRLRPICEQITDGEHLTPERIHDHQVPLVTAKNIRDGYMDYADTDWISDETAAKAWSRCKPSGGDLLMVCVGATTGRLCVLRENKPMVLVRSVAVIRPMSAIDVDFLALVLRSPMSQSQIWAKVKANAQPCLYINRIDSLPIPLPPLAEQRRIVTKVEELMGLCDALEAAQREREAVRTRLRTSALHQLTEPGSDSNPAAFVLQNLLRLTTEPEDLALLRQSIFQLAISGGLLARIDSWKTARLDSIAECRLGKMLDAHKNTGRPTKYLRNTNVHWFRFELDSIKELKLEAEEFAEYEVHPGDVMICEGGHGIGRTAVWRGEIQGIIFQKALHRVRPKKELHPDFFSYVMKVFHDTGVLSEFYTGAGIPHLTGQELKKIAIPLPPLAEQRRIVAKVEELMAVLDALEATLTSARTTAESLLAATVAQLHAA